ncbi:hypothetical protein LCGC14_0395500 [marine sediment metagenome]|uniref:Uncharacterized protein n=1 Tax=marine sediment metagenome TaxID=412755 RepID=A0A0F9T465_9ZZZZ
MSYAIICDARKGGKLGIETLALVDRSLTKKVWWTSDAEYLIMQFLKKSAVIYSCSKLHRNNARVVSYNTAVSLIKSQDNEITHLEALASSEVGWDGHKDSF